MYREVEGDVSALSRRIMLMEEEAKKSEENLAGTVTRLATTSKKADDILNKVKGVELQMVGEYMKSLDTSAEETEEKLKERILSIQRKYKATEGRFEYGEMSITKMNQ